MNTLEAATKAIEDVFADTSVSMEETKERLETLRDEIEWRIDALLDEITE